MWGKSRMGKTSQEVVEIIVAKLRNDVSDPLTGRASKNKEWIYDDLTSSRMDSSKYPRMQVYPGPVTPDLRGVGTQRTIDADRIVIDIFAKKTDKISIGSYSPARAEQMLGVLGQQVQDVIKDNHDHWVSEGILSIKVESVNSNYPRPGTGEDLLYYRITLRARVQN